MPKVTRRKANREVVYATPKVELCVGPKAITVKKAKELLGWTVVDSEAEHDLEDLEGNAVVLANNPSNRPLYTGVLATLQQEILRKRWTFNGESVIIGRTGLVLNGQHTLISLVLAGQEVEGAPDDYPEFEGGKVTIEKAIVYGVDESDETVNTMDTCKPRSLVDVIYRSEHFPKLKKGEKKAASRALSYAVKFLWDRTGVPTEEGAVRRTHSESMDFLARHPKLEKAVETIISENSSDDGVKGGRIEKYLSLGYAAGLLYLQAASKSDGAEYVNDRREKALDLSQWDEACEFWTLLAASAPEFAAVRSAYKELAESGNTNAADRLAILSLAWNRLADGKNLTKASIAPVYRIDEDGDRVLESVPTVGGVDILHIENVVVEGDEVEEEEQAENGNDPSPEEIADQKAKIRAEREEKAKSKVDVGSFVNVADSQSGDWQGEVVEIITGKGRSAMARVRCADGYEGAGEVFETPLKNVTVASAA